MLSERVEPLPLARLTMSSSYPKIGRKGLLRHILLLGLGIFVCKAAFAQDLDAAEIIRLAFEHDERNEILTRNIPSSSGLKSAPSTRKAGPSQRNREPTM